MAPAVGSVAVAWPDIAATGMDAAAAQGTVRHLLAERVGGTFWQGRPDIPPRSGRIVLCGAKDAIEARGLWRACLAASDAARVVLVLPPAGPRRGSRLLADEIRAAGGVALEGGFDPNLLLDQTDSLFAGDVTCLGALALLRGLPVMRQDEAGGWQQEDAARAAALLVRETRYRDPFDGRPCDADATIDQLAEWRRILLRNRSIAVCAGMSLWKRRRIADIFARAEPRNHPPFRRSARGAVAAARGGEGRLAGDIAVWSTRMPRELAEQAAASGIVLRRVEDGFIRSFGLGSDLLPPASVILDGRGIYFDPSRPSDLEHLLATHEFGPSLQARADRLIDLLVAGGISKYQAAGDAHEPGLPDVPAGRTIVLVPGQVADDLSVRLGGAGIGDNLTLLRAVRDARPDAFIVYRPHPDVDAGHRPGALADVEVLRHADRIARGGSMARLIAQVDELHTLTSLAGFEALLRGRHVVTYGQPFYAGWGLTEDRAPVARRTRRLSVAQLAAAVLILYPLYLDPRTRLPCGPEVLISRFSEPALWRPSPLTVLRRAQGRLRRAVRRILLARRMQPVTPLAEATNV